MITGDEYRNALISRGYVLSPEGFWTKKGRVENQRDPSPAEDAKKGGEAAELSGPKLSRPVIQEREDLDREGPEGPATCPAVPDHGAGVSIVEGESRATFRVTVTLLIANDHRRDPTGALETIADTLIATRRRLSERANGGELESPKGKPRRRGRDNSNRKTHLKPIPPPEEEVPF